MTLSHATLDRSPRDSPEEIDTRYRLLFDNLIHGFAIQEIICDEQGKPCDFRILEVNKRWEEITGARAADVVGRTAREMFPDVVDADRGELAPALRDAPGRNVRWRFSMLAEIAGDRTLLRLVFANLISSAMRFTRDRDPAEIEIGASPAEDEVGIFVRDNGIGFDPAYSAKLFGIFQRLHPADEFEGTGIGLANVKRIVERHGGPVWAESEADRGAACFVSLPRSADAELQGKT